MLNYEARKVGHVEGLGDIHQIIAPLDKQILAFNRVGINSLVTPEETEMIRLAGVSNDYTRTCMTPIGVKGENPVLYKVSPFMNPAMARLAVDAHKRGECPALPIEFYEAVKQIAKDEEGEGLEPEDRTAHILSTSEDYNLKPEMDDARFIHGRPAKEYYSKFNHTSIRFYNLPTKNVPKGKCFVNYLWFSWPSGGSGLSARFRSLGDEYSAFGVLRETAFGGPQNFGYSLTEIAKANSEVIPAVFDAEGVRRLTDLVASALNKGLLERLRAGRQ